MEDVKVGVFLSDGGGQLSKVIDYDALASYVKEIPCVSLVKRGREFSREEGLNTIKDAVKRGEANRVVVAEGALKLAEVRILQAVKEAGLNPYLVEVIDLREHCAWPHRSQHKKATEKAKAMLLAAVERAKLLESIETVEFPVEKSALIIGGGLAGIQSAIDLADMGFKVHLVEKEPFLGGTSAKAGRFFPTDDCSMCVQSPSCDLKGITHTSRKCLYRSGFSEIPNLNIYTNTKVVEVKGAPGSYTITMEKKPLHVNETRCVQCDLCAEICPVETQDLFNAGLTTRKAIYTNSANVYPPVYVIDEAICKFHECAKCVDVCPTEAIDLNEKSERFTFDVGSIIIATGFEEFDPSVIKEYKYDVCPDVATQLELARMLDPFGPTHGRAVKPSNHEEAKKIVMIQCVGSRDTRYNLYCSGICCMIALKHALMIKDIDPEAEVYICYIDIRTTGRGHEDYYEKAREKGIKFVKGRPTEILRDPESGKLIVDVEDALSGDFLGIEADLVVLSTAFVPSKTARELAEVLGIELDEDGFFKEYNSKLRPTETKLRGVYICGGATFPKDAPTTSLQAHSASIKAAKFMSGGKIVKDLRIAVIDKQYCGDCEFCPVVCPYAAITHVEEKEGHGVESISELKCEGCGLCVGTCPLNAIELRHSTEAQLLAQIRALSSKIDSSDPVVLAICCSECGHTAVDSSGMAMMEYPPNVRIMRVPCTSIIKVHHYFEALKAGADAVMVVGCKTDGCHYEQGSVKAKQKIILAKKLLEGYGIEPERVEMFNIVMIEGNLFTEAAKMMTERAEKLGSLRNMLAV